MSYNLFVGIEIIHQATYSEYRQKITPILKEFKAQFLYDFETNALPSGNLGTRYNRIFVLSFPDSNKADDFFRLEKYQLLKESLLLNSVSELKIITVWND